MTPTEQVDPRVTNKCPTFSGRDTEWSKWSFIFESVGAVANLEPAMEGALTGFAEGKSADSRPKRSETSRHRGMETYQD